MGGRGASSGISVKGKKYGTEYSTVLKIGNIKFIVQNDKKSVKVPMETMTSGRVYAVVNYNKDIASIVYFDKTYKKERQIDLRHHHNGMKPHTHIGYVHDEFGTRGLLPKEKRMVDRVIRIWNNRNAY